MVNLLVSLRWFSIMVGRNPSGTRTTKTPRWTLRYPGSIESVIMASSGGSGTYNFGLRGLSLLTSNTARKKSSNCTHGLNTRPWVRLSMLRPATRLSRQNCQIQRELYKVIPSNTRSDVLNGVFTCSISSSITDI